MTNAPDKTPPVPGTGTRNDPTAPEGGNDRSLPEIVDGIPEDPSGPWTDEEIESTSRDTLMEENVDPALPEENPDRGPDADTLEINTDVADEEGLTAPEDTVDTHIPEEKH